MVNQFFLIKDNYEIHIFTLVYAALCPTGGNKD